MSLEKIKNKETAKYQLTKRFVGIFLGILLAMNFIYLLAAANFVYEFLETKASSVFETIQIQMDNQIDWEKQINTFVSKEDEDALIITSEGKDYLSEEAEEVFKELNLGKSIPFISKLIFSDEGIYYVDQKKVGPVNVQLAINSENTVELVHGMLMISVILNLLAIILGSLLIYRSVHRWSGDLRQMAQEIKNLNDSQSMSINVPEKSVEMKEVAVAFNELLQNKEASIERERQFITDASHDLKTPIAAIRGHVQLIQRRGEKHPEVIPKSITFIDKESQRLEKLSQQLLSLNKDNSMLGTENLSLSAIILDEVEKNSLLHDRSFELLIEEMIEVNGIRSDFQQVIQNIVENAIKYSAKETSIKIVLKKIENVVYFEVADEGIGILKEEKEAIFDRFYRADASRTSKIEGSGIGLSIVKKIVDAYHGEIRIEDNKPKGTRFIVMLPI